MRYVEEVMRIPFLWYLLHIPHSSALTSPTSQHLVVEVCNKSSTSQKQILAWQLMSLGVNFMHGNLRRVSGCNGMHHRSLEKCSRESSENYSIVKNNKRTILTIPRHSNILKSAQCEIYKLTIFLPESPSQVRAPVLGNQFLPARVLITKKGEKEGGAL